ncbi:MAG: hypothetical protein AAF489_15635, partial [Bacteroidota bacterium]
PNEPINEENLVLERTLSQSATTIIIPQYRGSESLTFEDNMQWAAFLTAYAVLDSDEAKSYLLDFIEVHGNTFTLDQLFTSESGASDFEIAFEGSFELFFNPPCKNCAPVSSGSNPGGIGSTGQQYAYETFRSFIVEENCLEIHLPSGMDLVFTESTTERQGSITTTAHPLVENASDNEGYKIFEAAIDSELVPQVDQNYLVNRNVILVRPYRESPNCDYEAILVSDFTAFLCGQDCNG